MPRARLSPGMSRYFRSRLGSTESLAVMQSRFSKGSGSALWDFISDPLLSQAASCREFTVVVKKPHLNHTAPFGNDALLLLIQLLGNLFPDVDIICPAMPCEDQQCVTFLKPPLHLFPPMKDRREQLEDKNESEPSAWPR